MKEPEEKLTEAEELLQECLDTFQCQDQNDMDLKSRIIKFLNTN